MPKAMLRTTSREPCAGNGEVRSAPLAGDGRNDKSVPRVSRADGAGVRVRLAGGAVIVALRALSVRPGASGTQGRIGLHRMAVRLSLRTGGCEQQ
jgi:hypothetical protein